MERLSLRWSFFSHVNICVGFSIDCLNMHELTGGSNIFFQLTYVRIAILPTRFRCDSGVL